MNKLLYGSIFLIFTLSFCSEKMPEQKDSIVISKELLKDKIKGAWAAQTIGVTFGAPVEFKYNTTIIQDNQKLEWNDSSLSVEYRDKPGTYDDIYMDLTFMKVIEEKGIDAPAQSFAESVANSEYPLWFANQTARYNVLNGLKPPQSGYWLNNPCADDIDFQIEADFAGIMSPGMINSATEICDRVGHIMNYGDGWYGGVYVASLYSLALISNDVKDIEDIAKKALTVIPQESKFAQCMADVIKWHDENPEDWKSTWFKTSRKWGVDIGSPVGVFQPFNIDAKINAAWVLIGLLYGDGDFTKTFEIATRCGDDADCNPASAGGILAAITGYSGIPDYWKKGLKEVEDKAFIGTDISLNNAYNMSYKHCELMIKKNGGEIRENDVVIKLQQPKTVGLEVAFQGHYPVKKVKTRQNGNEITFEFDGIGFATLGGPFIPRNHTEKEHVFNVQMFIDSTLIETANLPTLENKRRFTSFWRYQLPKGHHIVVLKILNPIDYGSLKIDNAIIYDSEPYNVGL